MNLKFRQIAESDLQMILDWRSSPAVSEFMYTDIEPSLETQKQWFHSIRSDSARRDWIIRVDGEDVGLLSIMKIDRTNQRCEWAYYLASPDVRGKGVGKSVETNVLRYVFEELDLNKLCCEVFVSNDLVIQIHEKYGSVVEGTRRQHIFKNDEFHDIVEMGILKSEWEEKIRGQLDYVRADFE